jgi:hypothetical protein
MLSSPLLRDRTLRNSEGNDILKNVDPDGNRNDPSVDDANLEVIEVFIFDHETLGKISKSFYLYWGSVFIGLFVFATLSTTSLHPTELTVVFVPSYLILFLLKFYPTLIFQAI